MPKGRSRKGTNRDRRLKLTEEQRRLLMADPEELEFSQDAFFQQLWAPFEGWSLKELRRWAEEWRAEHRHSK